MPSPLIGSSAFPTAQIEAAFRRIERECMAGLPLLNPALRVEAVGAAPWREHWLLGLITPWCMNLMLLPRGVASRRKQGTHERSFHHFPSGDYAFLGGDEPEIGVYQSCALISPMDRFPDQESARATALAALQALFEAPPDAGLAPESAAPAQDVSAEAARLSRRGFLCAGLGGR